MITGLQGLGYYLDKAVTHPLLTMVIGYIEGDGHRFTAAIQEAHPSLGLGGHSDWVNMNISTVRPVWSCVGVPGLFFRLDLTANPPHFDILHGGI